MSRTLPTRSLTTVYSVIIVIDRDALIHALKLNFLFYDHVLNFWVIFQSIFHVYCLTFIETTFLVFVILYNRVSF